MATDHLDTLGPALSRIGRVAMSIVGGEPDGVFLYVEAGEGWVGPSLYKDEGAQVRYFDSDGLELEYALFDLWDLAEPGKRWREMHYTIDSGRFHAEFGFDDLSLPDDGSIERRERVLRARYGNKPVIYPPLPGAVEYHPV